MSVLLDALKKAALEKKKRDNHALESSSETPYQIDTPPQNYTVIEVVNEHHPIDQVDELLTLDVDFDVAAKEHMATAELTVEPVEPPQDDRLHYLNDRQDLVQECSPNPDQHKTDIPPSAAKPIPNAVEVEQSDHTKAAAAQTQKAAFASLLQKNRALEKSNKKKMILSLIALVLLSVLVIGLYYYSAQMSSSAIVPNGEISKREKIQLNEIPEEQPEQELNLHPGVEQQDLTATQQASDVVTVQPSIPTSSMLTSSMPTKEAAKPVKTARAIPDKKSASKSVAPAISISQSHVSPFDTAIESAYQAFNQGDLLAAESLYQNALALNPQHRDALLGNAAVAMAQKRYQDALAFYQLVLDRSPKDEFAQGGIVAIASTEKASPELISKVNTLLQDHPESAHLHFLQGSLFALQLRWQAAQNSFFNAWAREPHRADFAYNLAIAFDHIQQPKEALRFYQKALENNATSAVKPDATAIKKRIAQLEGLHE